MRILHAINSADSTLGIERQVATLAVAQKTSGSDVMIAVDRPGVWADSCVESGVSVITCDQLQRPFVRLVAETPEETAALEDAVRGFLGHVDSFRPDIIHCHDLGGALVAIGAGNRANIPCVFTGDGPWATTGGWKRGLRFVTLCLNNYSYNELLQSEIPDASIHYIPNGTRVVPPGQLRRAGTGHAPSLMVVGELISRKGVDVLILAMVELRRRLGQACPVLNIYGDGERRGYLAEMADVLYLNDIVRFHGFKPGAMESCTSGDILVMSSRAEAGPQVVLEAMSRGMPIVATDVGDVANMLPDRRYGLVVPEDAVMPLAEAIELLLKDIELGGFDPDLVIERHRSEYSMEKLVERTDAVYDQLLNGSAAG
jgi:glycosyltransferase involved in cell wall biosynthesis